MLSVPVPNSGESRLEPTALAWKRHSFLPLPHVHPAHGQPVRRAGNRGGSSFFRKTDSPCLPQFITWCQASEYSILSGLDIRLLYTGTEYESRVDLPLFPQFSSCISLNLTDLIAPNFSSHRGVRRVLTSPVERSGTRRSVAGGCWRGLAVHHRANMVCTIPVGGHE